MDLVAILVFDEIWRRQPEINELQFVQIQLMIILEIFVMISNADILWLKIIIDVPTIVEISQKFCQLHRYLDDCFKLKSSPLILKHIS